jgi:hypothetical protein
MNIYEKLGDFFLNMAKLVIGGVILSAVMINKDASHTTILYIAGGVVSLALIVIGFLVYNINKK